MSRLTGSFSFSLFSAFYFFFFVTRGTSAARVCVERVLATIRRENYYGEVVLVDSSLSFILPLSQNIYKPDIVVLCNMIPQWYASFACYNLTNNRHPECILHMSLSNSPTNRNLHSLLCLTRILHRYHHHCYHRHRPCSFCLIPIRHWQSISSELATRRAALFLVQRHLAHVHYFHSAAQLRVILAVLCKCCGRNDIC